MSVATRMGNQRHRGVAAAVALAGATLVTALLGGCTTQPAASPRASGPLTVHIHLDRTRVTAGLNLSGYALLTNNTRRPLALEGCPDEWLLVGLESASIPFNPAIADDCFGKTPIAPLGTRRVAVSVSTTYTGCGGGQAGPPCPKFGAPQLPLGVYRVKVVQLGLPKGTTVALAAAVTIVNARTGSTSDPETASVLIEATGCAWTGTPASMRVPVSVTVTHDGVIVGRAWARGLGQFIFPAEPNERYVAHTSGHRGGAMHTSSGVQSYINLFSHYRAGSHWLWSCQH